VPPTGGGVRGAFVARPKEAIQVVRARGHQIIFVAFAAICRNCFVAFVLSRLGGMIGSGRLLFVAP
jgi:hypothetical protein